MGAYANCWLGEINVFASKNYVDSAVAGLFRPTEYYRLDWTDSSVPEFVRELYDEPEEDEQPRFYFYLAPAHVIRERLEVSGFSLENIQSLFEEWRRLELMRLDKEGATDSEEYRNLQATAAADWIEAKQEVLVKPEQALRSARWSKAAEVLDANYHGLWAFGLAEIRLALDTCGRDTWFVYDLTELVLCNELSESEALIQHELSGDSPPRLIVLTEGRTDTRYLRAALHLLYPHLAHYFAFMDFEGVPGGSGELANLVRAFRGAGIRNNVIAVFDNDSAGRASFRQLQSSERHEHIVAMLLPDLPLLRKYPTLGPTGMTEMDVNGLAASIELYFGTDVLAATECSYSPVQWTGYQKAVKTYQGELLNKSEVQSKFERKLERARTDQTYFAQADWSGMRAIWSNIFEISARMEKEHLLADVLQYHRLANM